MGFGLCWQPPVPAGLCAAGHPGAAASSTSALFAPNITGDQDKCRLVSGHHRRIFAKGEPADAGGGGAGQPLCGTAGRAAAVVPLS